MERLQIKLLSNSGELLRCVNCFAGQVTVLRGHSSADLQPYLRALAGIPGPERVSITIDDNEYSASHSNLIGFGERLNFQQFVQGIHQAVGRVGHEFGIG